MVITGPRVHACEIGDKEFGFSTNVGFYFRFTDRLIHSSVAMKLSHQSNCDDFEFYD